MSNVVGAHLRSPHWYLQLVMVDLAEQRRGLGEALLAPGLDRADAEGLPCYLETQREANLAYYARFGFEVSASFGGHAGLPPMWAMTRPPRP
jgi:GNAT superfamily N-acetyltransferase